MCTCCSLLVTLGGWWRGVASLGSVLLEMLVLITICLVRGEPVCDAIHVHLVSVPGHGT
jgi:hypothetical protein